MTEVTQQQNERDDIRETLDAHRGFLRRTVRDLTDEQAAMRSTVSELCLGGIIKHVTAVERAWTDFVRRGPVAMEFSPENMESHAAGFRMEPGDTLAALLADYEAAARETDDMVVSAPSLDESQPLPDAPWFPPGCPPVGAAGHAASDRRDGTARRPRRHHPGVNRRRQDDGLIGQACSPAAMSRSRASSAKLWGRPSAGRSPRRAAER